MLQARQLCHHIFDFCVGVMDFAIVYRGVVSKQQLRLDLLQAFQHRMHAGVRRDSSPQGADGSGCQHGYHCIGIIAYHGGDAVPSANAILFQGIGTLSDSLPQVPPRDVFASLFGCCDHGDGVVTGTICREQKILSKVETAPFEEVRPWEERDIRV